MRSLSQVLHRIKSSLFNRPARPELSLKRRRDAASKPRCLAVTCMWGEFHVGAFLDLNLATMLAPDNLPALTQHADFEYLIYTTATDAVRIKADPGYQRLCEIVTVSLNLFELDPTINVIAMHHRFWQDGIRRAKETDALIMLMPPDTLWANGSLGSLGQALRDGAQVTYMLYPRVVSETIMPALRTKFARDADLSLNIASDDMMALVLDHLHPIMASHMRFGTQVPVHPELYVWPVKGEGLLVRAAARELFCYRPGQYKQTPQTLLGELPPMEEVHVFQDSRTFLGLSLTPFWKDIDWYLRPHRLDPLFAGRWWIDYDSPINDHLSSLDFRFSCKATDEAAWRRTSQQADNFINHIKAAREFTRLLMTMKDIGCVGAAEYLASALRVHGIARRWPHRGPFLVFAPDEIAMTMRAAGPHPGDGTTVGGTLAVLRHYAAPLPDRPLRDGMTVRTLAGTDVIITDAARAAACGANIVLPIDRQLHAVRAIAPAKDDAAPAQGPGGRRDLVQPAVSSLT